MKYFLCILVIVVHVTCRDLGSTYKSTRWTNGRKETTCLTSSGKLGKCLPRSMCTEYVTYDSANYIFEGGYSCKRINDISVVCCPINRNTNKPLGNPNFHHSTQHTSSSIQSRSSVSVSASTSEPMLVASAAPVRYKRSSESITPVSNTSSSLSSDSNSSSNNSESSLSSTSSDAINESPTKPPPTSEVTKTTPIPKIEENDYATAFPEPPVCGISKGSFARVVGGNDANIGDFPWIAVIAYRVTNDSFIFKCGGSLITSQHTLTAAHCIRGYEETLYFVRLGEWDFTNHNRTRPVDALVKTMIIHEQFNATDVTNDIGILVFKRKILFTDLIRPICMPLSEELRTNNFENYRPFVAGWGRTSYQGKQASRLQMLQLPVVSEESCRRSYAPLEVIRIDRRVICAGGVLGQDACNGDSGGPLMQPIWDPTNYTTYFYQTGVVSLGMKCGTKGFPAVFTRVTEYIPWIRSHVLGPASS